MHDELNSKTCQTLVLLTEDSTIRDWLKFVVQWKAENPQMVVESRSSLDGDRIKEILGLGIKAEAELGEIALYAHHGSIAVKPISKFARFQRICELLSFLLPSSIQTKLFEPSFYDLKVKHAEIRKLHYSRLVCCWLFFCFGVQTLWIVLGCFFEIFKSHAGKLLLLLIPEAIRRFFSSGN